jgi:regulatory protein
MEFASATVDAVLAELTRMGYLDDAEFARVRAESAARFRQHGRRRAKTDLLRAGVAGDVAEAALAQVYEQDGRDTLAGARELARKQAPRLRKLDPAVARRRLVGMLQRRGFEYDDIKGVVDQVLGGDDEGELS